MIGSLVLTVRAQMHRRGLWLALATVLLGACADTPPELQRLPPDATILAFGDSLTFGTGAATDRSYPSELARLSGRRVINAGLPGEVSESGRRRLPALLDEHRPALLILCHGGNDFLRRLDKQALRDNLKAMIQAARERAIPVLLVGIPAPGLFLSTAEIYTEVAAATGVPLEDQAYAQVLSERELRADTVHPNAEGYRQVAEVIHARLVAAGAM